MSASPDYRLLADPGGFTQAANALASGYGPFAVDTERASAFRYDDRAFLVQINRRGAGTFLISPEGHRDAARDAFAPVLNSQEWIIHAASEDLRSLALLGLHPGSLFDTELAARIAGFDRPNLAAMVEHFIGVELEKGHGQEDWSATPLPAAWQDYAALDVVYLGDLADALAEHLDGAGKLRFAVEEFAYLRQCSMTAAKPKTWREVKGVSSLRSASELQVARALWRTRDAISRETDTSPGRVLSNKSLVEIARVQPTTGSELAQAVSKERLTRADARRWQRVVADALQEDRSTWPAPLQPDPLVPPSKSVWERNDPDSWAMLALARESITALAADLDIQPSVLLAPSTLKQVVWLAPRTGPTLDTHEAAHYLAQSGARPWQTELTAPLIARAHAAVFAVARADTARG